MAANKNTSRIIILFTAIAVIMCLLAVAFADELTSSFGGSGVRMEYESALFSSDEVMKVRISMSDKEWDRMLNDPMSEEYYVCDVNINGETVNNVAIRLKGNTSLMAIANDENSDRFSMKLEFDHYAEGQTCYGLDKLILNNNYADATNMKEAIIYDMYHFLEADASLCNYAQVYINGEYRGVYLALEGVEESFMLRNFGTQDGELYKPESMLPPPPGSEGFDPDNLTPPPGGMPPPPPAGDDGSLPPPPPMDSNGSDLNYTDDDPASYSTIWDSEITGTGDNDHRRVVTAIRNICEGNDLEKYLDVDNILRYMAVHTFSVNMDSFSGHMTHNYYLYEYNGQLNIFPWDYNLAFGGIGSESMTSLINDPVDTPYDGTDFFDALLTNREYSEIYHGYLERLVNEYVYGGRFDETYNRIRSQIDELVKNDPTAFYTYDEYVAASDMLYDTIRLRADSIEGQLNGTIPSTDEGQASDNSTFIDASAIDPEVMGVMTMGPAPHMQEDVVPTGEEGISEDVPDSSPGGLPPDDPPQGEEPQELPPPPDDMPPPPQGEAPQGMPPPPGGMPPPPSAAVSTPDPISPANIAICASCLVVMLMALLIVSKGVRRR
jgi:hypothetical protein